jgi:hypothetical protein
LQELPEKIVYSLPQVQHLPLYVMQQVNPHSSTDVKEIFESVSLSPNAFQVFAIRFQLVHH